MTEIQKTSIRVGLMTIIAIVLFLVSLAFISRWKAGNNGFKVNIKYKFLNNLSEGAPVRIAGGVNVGYVEKIYQKDLETYVTIYIDNILQNKIPKKPETRFDIFTQGLMGQKYINLYVPDAQEGDIFYKDGDVVIGIDPPSIDQMLISFSSWFDGKDGGQVLAQIVQETKIFISTLNEIVSENRSDIRLTVQHTRESLSTISVQLNVLMTRLNLLTADLADISKQNKEDIKIMLQNISLISSDLNEITKKINSGKGTIGKIVQDDQLYDNLYQTAKNANELFYKLKKEPWRLMFKE